MMQGLGIDVDYIGHDKMAELWPGLHLDDFAAFAYEPLGGRSEAYMAGMAFGASARKLGVTIRQSTPVASLLQNADGRVYGVTLANGDEVHAEQVILATGPWAPRTRRRCRRRHPGESPTGAACPDRPGCSDSGGAGAVGPGRTAIHLPRAER